MKTNISPIGTVSTGGRDVSFRANPITTNVGVGARVNDNIRANVGFNVGSGGVPVPSLVIGKGEGNAIGAGAGATAGAAAGTAILPGVGTAVGALVGSVVGSVGGGLFNPSRATRERRQRDAVIKAFQKINFIGPNRLLTNPDGSTFALDTIGAKEGLHGFKNPDKVSKDHTSDRQLFNFDVDYTNDLDYSASMAGITLTRLLAGGASTPVDQVGGMLSNAFLGKLGYGQEFNRDNFEQVMTNARAKYAESGIKSKDDMLALANAAFGDGRITDADYAVAEQAARMVFDNDYNLASQLMQGRYKGVNAAAETPMEGRGRDSKSVLGSPVITQEEAFDMTGQFFDRFRERYPSLGRQAQRGQSTINGLTALLGGVGAAAGLYRTINNISGGALGDVIRGGISEVGDLLGGGSSDYQLPEYAPDIMSWAGGASDIADAGGGLQLPDFDMGIQDVSTELPSFSWDF